MNLLHPFASSIVYMLIGYSEQDPVAEPVLAEPQVHIPPTMPSHHPKDRTKDSYTEFETRERRGFSRNLLPKLIAKLPTTTVGFTLAELMETPGILPSFLHADPKEVYGSMGLATTSSVAIRDREGRGLVFFIKDALDMPWEKGAGLNEIVSRAIVKLANIYKPPAPSPTDYRHKEFQKDCPDCGVYHFALWVATGQDNAKNPKHPTPHQAVLSRDITAASYKSQAVLDLFADLAQVLQSIGIFYEAIDPDAYVRYRANWEYFVHKTPLRLLDVSRRQCFLGLALLRGAQVGIHTDKGDVREGWVAMICSGNFEGGELCVPGLNLKLGHKPGDIIFFRSSLLEHFVGDFTGDRSSMVFFSHEKLMVK